MTLRISVRFGYAAGIVLVAMLATTAFGSVSASTGTKVNASLHKLLPGQIRKSGDLIVGTDAEYPPCENYPAGSGNMVGFEPDIWNAMAKVLGVKAEPVSITFAGLIPGVLDHRFPIAMECFTDTTTREAQVSFVDFMYDQDGVLTLASDSHGISTNPVTLCGLSAGEQTGNVEATAIQDLFDPYCAQKGKPPINLVTFTAEAQTLLALESGRVDFTLDDLDAEAYLAETSKTKLKVLTDPLLSRVYIGIVTTRSETGLKKALVGALKVIIKNGEYARILKKWHLQANSLTDVGINLASSKPLPVPTP